MSFPSRRHMASLLLNTKHLGSLRNTFYLSILSPRRSLLSFEGLSPRRSLSPLRRKVISFDALSLSPNDKLWCSLSPLWHQFPKRVFWNLSNGFGPWDTEQSNDKNVMLVEDKIHWVELDQKKYRTSGKLFFLLRSRWHRVVCFGGTERIRLDWKQQTGENEFIAEKTLVTSAH